MPLAIPWDIATMVNYQFVLVRDAIGRPVTGLSSTLPFALGNNNDLIRGWQALVEAGIVVERPLVGGHYSYYTYNAAGPAHYDAWALADDDHAPTKPRRSPRIPDVLLDWTL